MISTPSQGLAICAIDAFSKVPFGGNGATVVLLDSPAASAWMQALAAELAQSETAFLWFNGGQWCLRWFTPSCEVPLCGHATLAAALALCNWQKISIGNEYLFLTRSGELRIEIHGTNNASLDIPACGLLPRNHDSWMAELLGISPLAQWSSELSYGVLLVPPEYPLERLDPADPNWTNGLEKAWMVMQQASQPIDYQLRFFAPGLGISEDPVTGSAHALVAPWWCEHLGLKRVKGWQPSHRPGGMDCEPISDQKVRITGNGLLLWQGILPWKSIDNELNSWQLNNK
jgi:PhzF family phenazine biosynthesis protein